MTIGFPVALRNSRLDDITALLDAGAAGAKIKLYDGTRPATGGAATTLLATLTCSVTSFPGAAAGLMTANAITEDSSADATATVTWFRATDSDDNFVLDGDVAVSGSDMNINDINIVTGNPVSASSWIITAGNA